MNSKKPNPSNCFDNKNNFSSKSMSRPNSNYPPQVEKKPMKQAGDQHKVKEFFPSDLPFRARPVPDEKTSKVLTQKFDYPSYKETKPDKLRTNFVKQNENSVAQDSKISKRTSPNPMELGRRPNKNSFVESLLDDNNDGWITVKNNRPKSNLKKNIENLQVKPRPSSNKKVGKLSNSNKFTSLDKPGLHEIRPKPNCSSRLNVEILNKGASFGKDVQEPRPNSSNRYEPNFQSSKNFEKRISTQHNLHLSTGHDGNGNSFQHKSFIKKREENFPSLKDMAIKSSGTEMSKESEEKIQARFLKKLKSKEEKKRMREDKARLLKDNLRRDTKVNVISQEMIEKFSKATIHGSVSNTYMQYRAPNCEEEYPAIGVNRDSNQRFPNNFKISQYQQSERKDMNRPVYSKEIKLCDETKKSLPSYSSATRNTDRSNRTDIENENKLLERPIPALNFSQFVDSTFEVKKKVKSKDRMNLAIMSLLEIKQREKKKDGKMKLNVEQKPVKPVIEKHGKIRENSKKKISVLKKNILREKKRREELLFSLLKVENSPETSLCEKAIILPIEAEQNSAAPITSISSSIDLDAHRPASSPSIEKSHQLSKSSNSLNEDLSNSNEKILPSDSESLMNISGNQELKQLPRRIENASIIKEINILMNPVHSKKFREYCDQIVTPEINAVLSELIQLLVKFQDRLYQLDPLKAKIKRRFYCGLKESLKHMNRQVCIIMAPNLKPSPGPGCVDELVMKVLNKAAESGIPIVFGLTNRVIGRLCHKKVPVSCFSIVNYQGAQDSFNALMDLVPEAKREYQELLGSRGLTNWGQDDLETEGSSKENISSNEITDSLLLSLKVTEKMV